MCDRGLRLWIGVELDSVKTFWSPGFEAAPRIRLVLVLKSYTTLRGGRDHALVPIVFVLIGVSQGFDGLDEASRGRIGVITPLLDAPASPYLQPCDASLTPRDAHLAS